MAGPPGQRGLARCSKPGGRLSPPALASGGHPGERGMTSHDHKHLNLCGVSLLFWVRGGLRRRESAREVMSGGDLRTSQTVTQGLEPEGGQETPEIWAHQWRISPKLRHQRRQEGGGGCAEPGLSFLQPSGPAVCFYHSPPFGVYHSFWPLLGPSSPLLTAPPTEVAWEGGGCPRAPFQLLGECEFSPQRGRIPSVFLQVSWELGAWGRNTHLKAGPA